MLGLPMKPGTQCNCLHCNELFVADYRNRKRQKFCGKPECRKASKASSQRRWLQQPQNQDYFRGELNTRRVQDWRRAHPGYWRRQKPAAAALQEPLQDLCPAPDGAQGAQYQPITQDPAPSPAVALQDLCHDLYSAQPALVVGLISKLTDTMLQEDIARQARLLFNLGRDILGFKPQSVACRSP
jgi:hypothetical protein